MKKLASMAFCIILIALLTTPFAFGQGLDGLWFKAKTSIKGYTVDSSGNLNKITGSSINYLHLVWTDITVDQFYEFTVYDEAGNIIRLPGYPDMISLFWPVGANEEIVSDLDMRLGTSTSYADTFQTLIVKVKRDSEDSITSATLTSLGCEVYGGLIDGKDFYGGCTMKAKKVDAPVFP